MNARVTRLRRLAALEKKQHEQTATHARLAQASLHAAQSVVEEARAKEAEARAACSAALLDWNREAWLLGAAETGLAQKATQHARQFVTFAQTQMLAAQQQEAEARTRCKQMEAMLQSAQTQQQRHAVRAEQTDLEEVARMMRAQQMFVAERARNS